MPAEGFGALRRLWAVLGIAEQRAIKLLLLFSVLTSLAELGLLATVVPFALALSSPQAADLAGGGLSVERSGLYFLVAIALATVTRLVMLHLQVGTTKRIAEYLSLRSYSRTLLRPYTDHIATSTTQITASLTGRLDIVFETVIVSTMTAAGGLATIVAIAAALFFTSVWVTTIVFVAVAGAYGLFLRRSRAVVANQSARHSQAVSRSTRILAESLNGIRDILLAGSERQWLTAYSNVQNDLRGANARLSAIAATPRIIVEGIGFTVIVAVACILVATEASLTAPIPVLAVVILGSQRLLPVAQSLYAAWNNLNSGVPHLVEVLPLLELPDRATPQATHAPVLRDGLELRDLFYTYPGAAQATIRGANLLVAAGSTIGIVGRTGSGKSTLLDLAMGLLPADSGNLSVDGVRLTNDRLHRWRMGVAHVAQSVYLADATIAENIAMGSPEAAIDPAALRQAATLAQIADFIEQLPSGYDTQVGERGMRLSGGQRQRIGIARALYRKSNLLVLDEATSSLDGETERNVMDALDARSGRNTILIVTHRISTLSRCDQIYRLTDGVLSGPMQYSDVMTLTTGDDAPALAQCAP